MQIYIHRNDQQLGPFTEAEIHAQLASGTISPQDSVWWQGQANWMPLAQSSLMVPAGTVAPGAAGALPPVGVVQPTSKYATYALIAGCLSILCGIFASIPAIIFGHMGLKEIKKNPSLQGHGMALAGLILGYIFSALIMIYIVIVAISVFIALGNNSKSVFKTIDSQPKAADTNDADQTTPDQSTNSATAAPVNAPDSTTPAATPDQTTNSAPAGPVNTPPTNAPPDSSTNAAPMSQ